MRISTKSIFETGANQIGTLQSQLAKTQQQLSTNRRMLSAADDPIASARALDVTQSQSINTQLVTNRQNARSSLSLVEVALNDAASVVQDAQTIAVQAGNPTLTQADRESLATALSGRLDALMGIANSADGAGGYLFSGYKSTTQPFTQTATGAKYQGDQGQRQLQVGSARQLAISDSGAAVFENIPTGNGTFQTAAGAANTGSGLVSAGVVTAASQLTGHTYTISFAASDPTSTTYTIMDQTTNLPVPPPPAQAVPQPYVSGQQISFDGLAFDVKGAPANGDTFTVVPSQKQSVFTTMTKLIATLRTPSTGAPGQNTSLTNSLNTAQGNLSAALDNVLSVTASVGSRMKELDSLDTSGSDLNIQYAGTLSQLQDLDMTQAISTYTQQQLTLDAAQKSFKSLSSLSLFNYLP